MRVRSRQLDMKIVCYNLHPSTSDFGSFILGKDQGVLNLNSKQETSYITQSLHQEETYVLRLTHILDLVTLVILISHKNFQIP